MLKKQEDIAKMAQNIENQQATAQQSKTSPQKEATSVTQVAASQFATHAKRGNAEKSTSPKPGAVGH